MEINKIIEKLKKNSDLLFDLSPRLFEEVVAELLASFGWEVNLTPPTRDGGYDIIAISKDPSGLETTWIIECKKYRSDRKVGIDIAQRLYFIKTNLSASNAILIATTNFTHGVKKFIESKYDIQIVDIERLKDWLRKYTPAPDYKLYLEDKRFYSCFISYSHKDSEFASFLNAALRGRGIRVWFAPEEMLPGEKMHTQIKDAIRLFDKLIIILSNNSMNSEWVKTEIRAARKRELEDNRRVIFPIGLAPIEAIKKWECFDADIGKDLAVELREYYIPDLSKWKNPVEFNVQIEKVIKALRIS